VLGRSVQGSSVSRRRRSSAAAARAAAWLRAPAACRLRDTIATQQCSDMEPRCRRAVVSVSHAAAGSWPPPPPPLGNRTSVQRRCVTGDAIGG